MSESDAESKVQLSLLELLVVVGIISTEAAFLVPAIIAANDRDSRYGADSWQYWLTQNLWFALVFPFLSVGICGLTAAAVSCVLPASLKKYFQWKPIRRPRPQASVTEPRLLETPRPAIISSILAPIASVVLIVAASHVRADRQTRRPVVTWEGPLADYIQWISYLGWGLSVAAIACGVFTVAGCKSRFNWLGWVGMTIGSLNFLGSCFFYAAVYED